uniref:Uncharacterized protein n=1 Tax=Anguilla anguilla TaxID=7936 RepID=A0A0E9UP72_ANGAN
MIFPFFSSEMRSKVMATESIHPTGATLQ